MSYHVIVDTREKHPWVFPTEELCAGYSFSKLDTGDYTIRGLESSFTIERKMSVNEVATNLVSARFYKELARMEHYEFPFLICEFGMSDLYQYPYGSSVPKYKWNKIRVKGDFLIKLFLDMQLNYKVKVILAEQKGRDIAKSLFKRMCLK